MFAVTLSASAAFAAPMITGISPSTYYTIGSSKPLFKVLVEDQAPPLTAVFEIEGRVYPGVPDVTGLEFSAQPDVKLPDGSVTATVTVTNALGESSSGTWRPTIGAPPIMSVGNPAMNSVTTSRLPLVYAYVDDNGSPATWSLTIDGTPVQSAYASPYDPTASTYYMQGYPAAQLADGEHTVVASVTDAGGRTGTVTWKFVVNGSVDVQLSGITNGETTSNAMPAWHIMGTSVYSQPTVGTTIDGSGNTYRTTPVLSNGNRQVDMTATPNWPLADGTHTIVGSVSASPSLSKSTSLTFSVVSPPDVIHLRPAPEVVTTDVTPMLVARATDNEDVTPTVQFKLDGEEVGSTVRRIAIRRFEAAAPVLAEIAADATHTAEVTFTDKNGYATTKSWKFVVNGGTRMSHYDAKAACIDCHTNVNWTNHSERIVFARQYPCNACHSTFGSHSGWTRAKPEDPATYLVRSCSCHDPGSPTSQYYSGITAHSWYIYGSACRSCHTEVNAFNDLGEVPNGRGVTEPLLSETPRHDTSSDMSKCAQCHKAELTFEHAGRTDSSGNQMDCTTCHRSADAAVQTAIANGDTSCSACHTDTQHAALHASTPPARCTESCHTGVLSTEHANRGVACEACHESADATVKAAMDAGDKACGTCHPAAHSAAHTSATSSNCFGSGCHNPTKNLAVVHNGLAGPDTERPQYADTCALCHGNAAVDTTKSDKRCTGLCHAGTTHQGRPAGHAFSSATSQKCASCHGQGDLDNAHGTYSDLSKCGWCHSDPKGLWDVKPECQNCHASNAHVTEHVISNDCTVSGCHATSAMAIHEQVGCDACHGTGVTPSLACASCHSTVSHTGVSHATTESCSGCHAVADLISLHDGDCATCHPGPADGAWDRTCASTGCHPNRHSTIDFDHQQDHSATEYGSDCWSCHHTDGPDWQCRSCHPVNADTTAPSVSTDARTSYAGSARITFAAADVGANPSGVQSITYRLDGGAPVVRSALDVAAPASGSATHTVEYWAQDAARNSSAHKTATFVVGQPDTQAPVTLSDAKLAYTGSARVAFSATDAGGSGLKSTFYRLDGGVVASGASVTVAPPVSGSASHTLEFWSEDNAGNVELRNVVAFTVTAPVANGTINFAWSSPPDGSWAEVWVKDSTGKVVYHADSSSWNNGWFTATVPVDAKAYRLVATWYDSESDVQDTTSSTALIDKSGKVVTWWY